MVLSSFLSRLRYSPYNPDPMYLKKKTDRAMKLLDEINSVVINQNKMKPREVKALAQVKLRQHSFNSIENSKWQKCAPVDCVTFLFLVMLFDPYCITIESCEQVS